MAQKRMFTMKIVDSDAFLDMPLSTQCLYFHLNMRADDDGFVGNPKKIMRMIGASDDDFKILLAKKFLIIFENNVVVIKHWWMHNTLAKDRYQETSYTDEKAQLKLKENKSYTLGSDGKPIEKPVCYQNVNKMLSKCYQNDNTDIDIDIDIDKELDIDLVSEEKKKTAKPKKVSLRFREPENNYECVEKAYIELWDSLYSQKKVNTPDPLISSSSWLKIRKLEKGLFDNNISVDALRNAIKKAASDNFIINNGYSFEIILSNNVINRLINGSVSNNQSQYKKNTQPSFEGKYDMASFLRGNNHE